MPDFDAAILETFVRQRWSKEPRPNAKKYIGKFFDTVLIGNKVVGKTIGNHGTYTVAIESKDNEFVPACSCYIGKHGYCHHCEALAQTYLLNPITFIEIQPKQPEDVKQVDALAAYLQSITLENLMLQLREKGITHTAFALSIGMNSRHLSAIKSAEARNHFFKELGAIKLACLWMLEHYEKFQKK